MRRGWPGTSPKSLELGICVNDGEEESWAMSGVAASKKEKQNFAM